MARSKYSKSQVKDIIMEDLDEKKPYTASWDFDCEIGFDTISEGDEFFYIAGKKVCNDCRSEIRDVVEEM